MTDSRQAVQSLSRGLAALTALNQVGPMALSDLCQRLDLPRTTVRRIMTTLIEEGCCLRLDSSRLYGLAPGVERLTAGYGVAERLTAVSAKMLPRLGQDIRWPVALAAPDHLVMRVRVSTDFVSPYALARMRPGYATPMVETTTGLIYLASLEASEAASRLDSIYAARWRSPLRFNRLEVEALMDRARIDDHLVLERRFPEASLGVPLRIDGQVHGGLVLRYLRSAVKREAVRAELLPRLREAADRVVREAQAAGSGAVAGS